jgi:hypothetical protein
MALPKSMRLQFIFQGLQDHAAAADHDGAMEMLSDEVRKVEDRFSDVPYDPEEPGSDGRMYPPDERFRYPLWEKPDIRCYRQVAHATFVAENGAVEIRSRMGSELGKIIFEKPGKDGRRVSDYDALK